MAGASTLRVVGQQVSLVCTTAGGAVTTDWDNFTAECEYMTATATAAASAYEEVALTITKISGKVTGWLGTSGIPPVAGDTISALSATGLSQSLTASGALVVTKTNYDYKVDPAKWTFDFRSGLVS
jgi:hypothetical protein